MKRRSIIFTGVFSIAAALGVSIILCKLYQTVSSEDRVSSAPQTRTSARDNPITYSGTMVESNSGQVISNTMNSTVTPDSIIGGGGDKCTNAGSSWNVKTSNGDAYDFGTCAYDGGGGNMITEWRLTSYVGSINTINFSPEYDGYYAGPTVKRYPSPLTADGDQIEEYLGEGSHTVDIAGTVIFTSGGEGSYNNPNSAYLS
ncbi:hypothetical protein [Alicyclobacillus suci]|uniref:hypothetical protein n=1 Tax=Alicyclobacillus suci TaxID=2816080 RepID=UPI001A8EE908|nr:hypothetical protein [Alicyclobacillus suci]